MGLDHLKHNKGVLLAQNKWLMNGITEWRLIISISILKYSEGCHHKYYEIEPVHGIPAEP